MKCKYCGTKLKKGIEVCHKCGRVNKTPFKMNTKRAVISGAAVLITLVIAIGTIFAVTGSSKSMEARLVDEDTGEYMLVNAPTDLALEVKLKKGKTSDGIIVEDIYGGRVNTFAEVSSGTVKINAPQDGYTKGEVYTIDLKGKGSFINKEFKDARKLIFIIEKQNTNVVEYKPGVKTLADKKVRKNGSELIIKGNYKNNDIIVCDSDGNKIDEVYKLTNVEVTDGYTIANSEEATADEVYEKLDIFYYDVVDLSKADVDEEAVGEMLETSGIIEVFTDEAYAAEDIKYKAEFDGDKNFKITIKDPKDEKRRLEIKFSVADKVLFKCNLRTIMLDNTLQITSGIELSIRGEKEGSAEKNIRAAIENYVADKNSVVSKNDYKQAIIPITIPIVGPAGVYVDLGASASYKVSAEFKAGAEAELEFNQGIIYDLNKLKIMEKYADISGDLNAEMMAKGQLDMYAGLYLEAGVDVAAVANAGIRAEGGPYLEGKGCFVVKEIPENPKPDGYYKIDTGLRFKAKATMDLPLMREKTFKLGQADKSFKQYSKYLTLESFSINDEYYKTADGIYIGAIMAEYYDKIEDKELFEEIDKYTLYIDGDKSKLEDGILHKDLKEGKHTFKLEWKYEGQKFEKKKEVQITEFDPWGQFYSVNVLGKTYGEIESEYGPLVEVDNEVGGTFFKTSRDDFLVAFPILDLEDESISNEDIVCTGIDGNMRYLFGLDTSCTYEELIDVLGANISFTNDGEHQGYFFSSYNYNNPHEYYNFCVLQGYYDNDDIILPEDRCMVTYHYD